MLVVSNVFLSFIHRDSESIIHNFKEPISIFWDSFQYLKTNQKVEYYIFMYFGSFFQLLLSIGNFLGFSTVCKLITYACHHKLLFITNSTNGQNFKEIIEWNWPSQMWVQNFFKQRHIMVRVRHILMIYIRQVLFFPILWFIGCLDKIMFTT